MTSQSIFRAALLDASVAVPAGLTDGAGRPAPKRFAVYRNNVAVSLTEALEAGFPAIARLLGADNFSIISGTYLRAHPPTSPLMMLYGADFPTFLAGVEPLAHLGYLPDVARLEYALRGAYHAADATPIDPATLPNQTHLPLAPATQLVRSDWPIFSIRARALSDDAPQPPVRPETVLITRPGFDPQAQIISPATADFITALLANTALDSAIDIALRTDADFDLTAALTMLLAQNAIISLTTEVPT
ncbi:DNA-binding domain-containing protein [Thalassovita taeanensis]|uniref:Putative DNA-binding domain-containing protein n=1 Tax=Thalassovita taeanensis TaxID=657014 RepID=A0A1H9HF98_9RHOB|nr:DNA-binding domain-containing protein [Thalassovita taeanensis]SEQ61021.1 hypothetical protein SAMN04488092_10999 [Thalassovita taeanensis]